MDRLTDLIKRVFNWLFRNRKTNRITIVQIPNVWLIIFLVAALSQALFHPSGNASTAVDVISVGALVIWALDELFRGVNLARRMVGGAVLVFELLTHVGH